MEIGLYTFADVGARLYREAARRAGHDPARMAISINSHT
jgi:hypothetical protein